MRCPICDAANPQEATSCSRCGFALTLAVRAWSPITPEGSQRPPREEAPGRGKETGWKAQLTNLEGVPSVSRGWKIVLAPVFFYLMVGTGALFLVSELEKLVYRLGHAVRARGLSDRSATEWHTKDLRLVLAFPIVAPLLAQRRTPC